MTPKRIINNIMSKIRSYFGRQKQPSFPGVDPNLKTPFIMSVKDVLKTFDKNIPGGRALMPWPVKQQKQFIADIISGHPCPLLKVFNGKYILDGRCRLNAIQNVLDNKSLSSTVRETILNYNLILHNTNEEDYISP